MSTRILFRTLFTTLLVLIILASQVQSQVISNKLKESLEKNRIGNIIVTFKTRPLEALNRVVEKIRTIKNRGERLHLLSNELENNAFKSQNTTLEMLQSKRAKYFSLWLTNQVSVRGASIDLVNTIGSLPEVLRVEECKTFVFPQEKFQNSSTTLIEDIFSEPQEGHDLPVDVEPIGLYMDKLEVAKAWKLGFFGSGIVIGIIDTGVVGTHDALRDNYVGTKNYGWFDAVNTTKYPIAVEKYGFGHGTCCLGAAVAQYGIGVAPAAKWMACLAADEDGIWYEDLVLSCLQFMLCPTDYQGNNKNCSKAPNIVTNSWYYPSGEDDSVLREITPVLVESQIHFLFCAGNEGPGCGTVAAPGSYKDFIAVGAGTHEDNLQDYSSWGPGDDGIIKPDVIAGGKWVHTTCTGSDYTYTTAEGCSLATPMVAGVVALMLQKNPSLSPAEVKQILMKTTTNVTALNEDECGGVPVNKIPNHQIGYGFVNAFNAVNSVPVS
ncbi:unnamed protein product [Allacma fusca]|uniref:Peptidase S8/S53 domain-containing protein n=1 Tax=Allacma fusca TaxID=39272 RepID=A0A8J2KFZ2_9HEXA|nr:unnamed protein product [Allacma fusca]